MKAGARPIAVLPFATGKTAPTQRPRERTRSAEEAGLKKVKKVKKVAQVADSGAKLLNRPAHELSCKEAGHA
jgi:hypothetical protein